MFKCLATVVAVADSCKLGVSGVLAIADISAACNKLLELPTCPSDGLKSKECLSTTAYASPLSCGPSSLNIVVVGALGGRFDQTAQSINALVCW